MDKFAAIFLDQTAVCAPVARDSDQPPPTLSRLDQIPQPDTVASAP